jgi:hypothetical protein
VSIAPLHRDTRGEKPMVPPHLLARILDRLNKQRGKINDERNTADDAWSGIDALAETMEAAKQ